MLKKILISDLSCENCAKIVTQALNHLPGISDLVVNQKHKYVFGDFGSNKNEVITKTVIEAGYNVRAIDNVGSDYYYL